MGIAPCMLNYPIGFPLLYPLHNISPIQVGKRLPRFSNHRAVSSLMYSSFVSYTG